MKRLLAIVFFFSLPAFAGEAKVSYVSGATIYFEAGSDDGVVEGSVVEVVRDGKVVARIRVGTVSVKRASGVPEGEGVEIRVGDVVRFAEATAKPAPAAPVPQPATPKRTLRDAGIRGRVGVRYLSVRDRSGFGQDFSQPALDVRVSGKGVGGSSFDFDVDFRPRRTYRTLNDGSKDTTSSNRLYQASAAYRPGDFRIAAGRLRNPSLAPVVMFDGLLGEYRKGRWATGIWTGTEPDPEDWGYDSSTKDYGAYVEATNLTGAATRWWASLGALSSTREGEINRDVVYASGRLSRGGFHGYLMQEVDVNRGWRKEAEGSSFTRSGSYLSARWSSESLVSVHAGWDSRRSVRLYRDFVTPATEFDDAYRTGYWGGVDFRPKRRWLVGVEGRSSSGGVAGSADAYTVRAGVRDLTSLSLDVHARGTHYSGPTLDGDLYTAGVGMELGTRVHLEVHGGGRSETVKTALGGDRSVTWFGTDLDVFFGRHGLATLSYDRTSGGDEDNDQLYATVSYRF